MKKAKKVFSWVLVIAVMVSILCIPASAASSYDVFSTRSITVTTGSSGTPSMTFKSTGDGSWMPGAKAPILTLTVYNHKTGTTQYYRITGSRIFNYITSTLYLERNTRYTVTVSYKYDSSLNYGKVVVAGYGNTYRWYGGYWTITSAKNLSYTVR